MQRVPLLSWTTARATRPRRRRTASSTTPWPPHPQPAARREYRHAAHGAAFYDTANRLSAQGWTIGGTSYRESYAYDASDGSLTTLNTAVGTKIGYNYDALKRLRSRAVYQGSTPLFENRYAYATQSGNQSTALVEFFNYRLASDDGNGDIIVGYQYEYDKGGNITDIKAEVDGALIPLEHYEYDEKQGQLKTAIRYENGEEVDRWTYSYDTAGNILSEDHEGTVSEVHEYAYEDGRWGDLLTSVDGIDLEYDGSGNPTLYANGTELLWNMEGRTAASSAARPPSATARPRTSSILPTTQTASARVKPIPFAPLHKFRNIPSRSRLMARLSKL